MDLKKLCYLKLDIIDILKIHSKIHMANVLVSMEEDTELFETLVYSHPNRLRVVNNANSRHTDY